MMYCIPACVHLRWHDSKHTLTLKTYWMPLMSFLKHIKDIVWLDSHIAKQPPLYIRYKTINCQYKEVSFLNLNGSENGGNWFLNSEFCSENMILTCRPATGWMKGFNVNVSFKEGQKSLNSVFTCSLYKLLYIICFNTNLLLVIKYQQKRLS